jgi:hypothetical protein
MNRQSYYKLFIGYISLIKGGSLIFLFCSDYFKRALTEMYEDGVQYMEFR